MSNEETKIPEINLNLKSKTIEGGSIYVPYVLVSTPYMMVSDCHGTRKVWIKSKRKIILYYLYKLTKILWFIKKYNQ